MVKQLFNNFLEEQKQNLHYVPFRLQMLLRYRNKINILFSIHINNVTLISPRLKIWQIYVNF